MSIRFENLDPASIVETLILSDLDLGRWTDRLIAARGILRAVATESRLLPADVCAAYREVRSEGASMARVGQIIGMPTMLAARRALELAVTLARDDVGIVHERLIPMGGEGLPIAFLLAHLVSIRMHQPADVLARIGYAYHNRMALWPSIAVLIDSLKVAGVLADDFSPLLDPATRGPCAWGFMVVDHSVHAPLAALVMAAGDPKSSLHDLQRHKKRLIRIVREEGQRRSKDQAVTGASARMVAAVIDSLTEKSNPKRRSTLKESLTAFRQRDDDPSVDGRVVIPALRRHPGEHITSAGDKLPIVRSTMSAIRQVTRDLQASYPWLAQPIADIMGALFVAAGEEVRIHPTILVGPPGCGKTRLIGEIAKALGMPRLFLAATGDDVAVDLAGSSARWSSSQPSLVAKAFDRYRSATLIVHLDEIEKSPERREYPSLYATLLTLLEPSTAGAIRDPALNVEIDASGVSWLFTANSLRGIPDPLTDRCRVIKCAAPGAEHLEILATSMAREILATRGYQAEALEAFDEVELRLMARTWRGGSTRALQRIVEAMIDARVAWNSGPRLN